MPFWFLQPLQHFLPKNDRKVCRVQHFLFFIKLKLQKKRKIKQKTQTAFSTQSPWYDNEFQVKIMTINAKRYVFKFFPRWKYWKQVCLSKVKHHPLDRILMKMYVRKTPPPPWNTKQIEGFCLILGCFFVHFIICASQITMVCWDQGVEQESDTESTQKNGPQESNNFQLLLY